MKKFLFLLLFIPLIAQAQTYSVKAGDTVTKIARQFHTTSDLLVFENGIKNRDYIFVGQKLEISQPEKIAINKQEPLLGATSGGNGNYNPVTGYQTRTSQYVSASATTIPVVSTKDLSGNQINLSNISSAVIVKVYMTFEPGTTKEEPFMCTGLTATSWTNCTRGLPFQSGSEITSTTVAQPHNAGAAVIITNIGQFYNQFISVDGNQTINNIKTFSSYPLLPSSSPTNPLNPITLQYLTTVTTTGCADASTVVRGCVQEATSTQFDGTGSTGARLFIGPTISTSTAAGTTTAGFVIRARFDGKIDSSFGGATSSFATTNSNNLVVQNPAIATSTGGTGVIPITDASSTLRNFGLFGGTGADGPLVIASGTTTINLAGVSYLEKNYTSCVINGTGALAFSNSGPQGTIIVFKCKTGGFTVTTTANPAIDLRSIGAPGGAIANNGTNGIGLIAGPRLGFAGVSATGGGKGFGLNTVTSSFFGKVINIFTGSGGGGGITCSGSNTAGAGGAGAGGMYVEAVGDWYVTSTINAAGAAGVAGAGSTNCTNRAGGGGGGSALDGSDGGGSSANIGAAGGGGGGGGGGTFKGIYSGNLISNVGTCVVTGGLGGVGGDTSTGGDGGRGSCSVGKNYDWF